MLTSDALGILTAISEGDLSREIPGALSQIQPFTPLAVELSQQLSGERLISLTELVASGRKVELTPTVICLLHQFANNARNANEKAVAISWFERVLEITPHDFNVRAALSEYMSAHEEPARLLRILSPAVDIFVERSAVYRDVLASFCRVALLEGDRNDIAVGLRAYERITDTRAAALIRQRVEHTLSSGDDASTNVSAPISKALRSLCEYDCLSALEAQLGQPFEPSERFATLVAKVARSALTENWRQAYRLAADLMRQVSDASPSVDATKIWRQEGLDARALDFREPVTERHFNDFTHALSSFHSAPSLPNLQKFWTSAARARSDLEAFRLVGPTGQRDTDEAEATSRREAYYARTQPSVADDGRNAATVWYFITWQDNVEQLVRQILAIYHPKNVYVVSIGGLRAPPSLSHLSILLSLPNFHLLYRPSVTWGGQKLFFHNLFEVLQAFSEQAEDPAWVQVLCHRSFPLVNQTKLRKELSDTGILKTFIGTRPSHAWQIEWPDDVVTDLDARFGRAMDEIFETGSSRNFRELIPDQWRQGGCRFNFGDEVHSSIGDSRTDAHDYAISAMSGDLRWPSLGRLTEFVDVATESGATYTRRMHPIVVEHISKVFRRHQMMTGDPFLLMNQRFVETVLTNDDAKELFAAMNPGFAPEMNFFDTVIATPAYGVSGEAGHVYHRNEQSQAATAVDIEPAAFAADAKKRYYMRKMLGEHSKDFIEYFNERASADWDARSYYLSGSVASPSSLPPSTFPSLDQAIVDRLLGRRCMLHNLHGVLLGVFFLMPGGVAQGEDGTEAARWAFNNGTLSVVWSWGAKNYRRMTTDGTSLVLVPAEVAEAANNWSLFLRFEIESICATDDMQSSIIDVPDLGIEVGQYEWVGSHLSEASALVSFDRQALEHYPTSAQRHLVTVHEARVAASGDTLCLASVDGFPTLIRLSNVWIADARIRCVFQVACADDHRAWEAAKPGSGQICFSRAHLVGAYRFQTLAGGMEVTLAEDGRLQDEAGRTVGGWFSLPGRILLFGLPGMRVAQAAQLVIRDGRASISGWAWKNLKDLVSFSATPLPSR